MSMIDVYRESLVSPVGHGGSTATGPSEYCPLGFRAQESPERTSELAAAWAKLTTFKLSAAQL